MSEPGRPSRTSQAYGRPADAPPASDSNPQLKSRHQAKRKTSDDTRTLRLRGFGPGTANPRVASAQHDTAISAKGERAGLPFGLHCRQALPVEIQEVAGVVFGLRDRVALKTSARRTGFSISGGDSDKFHQVERDVFVATRPHTDTAPFLHEC